MTEPFRLPLDLSEDETMELRYALAAYAYSDAAMALIRRLEDHTGRIAREREAQRHASAIAMARK